MSNQPYYIDEKFYQALAGEDDLGVVVRAQIHVESSVIEFINQKISDLKSLRRLRFGQRTELACELGLSSELKNPLKKLGDLRNDFAHKLDTTLSQDKVDSFHNTFGEEAKIFFQTAYEATESQMLKNTLNFSDLCPKDKFVIMAAVLKARIVVEVSKSWFKLYKIE